MLNIAFKPVSEAQKAVLQQLGVTQAVQSSEQASRLIWQAQASIAMRPATKAQRGKVYTIGLSEADAEGKQTRLTSWVGRDLPDSRHREISFQIELLECLAKLDTATSQADVNAAAVEMIETVRRRMSKPYRGSTFVDHAVTPEGEEAPF